MPVALTRRAVRAQLYASYCNELCLRRASHGFFDDVGTRLDVDDPDRTFRQARAAPPERRRRASATSLRRHLISQFREANDPDDLSVAVKPVALALRPQH